MTIIFAGIIAIASIIIRILVSKLRNESFALFSRLKISTASERIEKLSIYMESHLKEFRK